MRVGVGYGYPSHAGCITHGLQGLTSGEKRWCVSPAPAVKPDQEGCGRASLQGLGAMWICEDSHRGTRMTMVAPLGCSRVRGGKGVGWQHC